MKKDIFWIRISSLNRIIFSLRMLVINLIKLLEMSYSKNINLRAVAKKRDTRKKDEPEKEIE